MIIDGVQPFLVEVLALLQSQVLGCGAGVLVLFQRAGDRSFGRTFANYLRNWLVVDLGHKSLENLRVLLVQRARLTWILLGQLGSRVTFMHLV